MNNAQDNWFNKLELLELELELLDHLGDYRWFATSVAIRRWHVEPLALAKRLAIVNAVRTGVPFYAKLHNILTRARMYGADVQGWPPFEHEDSE